MVAAPAVVAVELPETAPLGVEVPGTGEAVPGAVVAEKDPRKAEGKTARGDLSENRSRNSIQCPLS